MPASSFSAIHVFYRKLFTCCCFIYCSSELDYHFRDRRLTGYLCYILVVLWALLTLCVSGLIGGTHTGQQLTRTSCFPSPLPRPAHHYFVWTRAVCHMCITLSGCFIYTIATAALCAQTVRYLWLNAPVAQTGGSFVVWMYLWSSPSGVYKLCSDMRSFFTLFFWQTGISLIQTAGLKSWCDLTSDWRIWIHRAQYHRTITSKEKMNSTVLPYRQMDGTLVCVLSTFFFFFFFLQWNRVPWVQQQGDVRIRWLFQAARSMRSMWAEPSESIWILWGQRMLWFFSQNNVVMSWEQFQNHALTCHGQ